MKRSTVYFLAASAVIIVGGTALTSAVAADRSGWGPGWGPCMGAGYGQSYDRADRGRKGWFRGGKGGRFANVDRNLTAEDIRTLAEARMIMRGNDNLKVGEVTKASDDTYKVTIVTKDDSLVREVEVSRKTGFPVR